MALDKAAVAHIAAGIHAVMLEPGGFDNFRNQIHQVAFAGGAEIEQGRPA